MGIFINLSVRKFGLFFLCFLTFSTLIISSSHFSPAFADTCDGSGTCYADPPVPTDVQDPCHPQDGCTSQDQSTYDASCLSITGVPGTVYTGDQFRVTISMRNTGHNTTWTANSNFNLGKVGDDYNWGLNRVSTTSDVAPDTTYNYVFTVTAPSSAGTYDFTWKMVQDGGSAGWFGTGCSSSINVNTRPANASCLSIDLNGGTVISGKTYTAKVTMHNDGGTTWTSANNYHVGSQGATSRDQDNSYWGTNRGNLETASVSPGGDGVFDVSVTAPTVSQETSHSFDWQMVQDAIGGDGWFGDICRSNVNIEPYPPHVTISTPDCISAGDTGDKITYSWDTPNPILTYIDVSTTSNFADGTWQNKQLTSRNTTVSRGETSTPGKDFSASWTYAPDTTYYVRTYNGYTNDQAPYPSFKISSCGGPEPGISIQEITPSGFSGSTQYSGSQNPKGFNYFNGMKITASATGGSETYNSFYFAMYDKALGDKITGNNESVITDLKNRIGSNLNNGVLLGYDSNKKCGDLSNSTYCVWNGSGWTDITNSTGSRTPIGSNYRVGVSSSDSIPTWVLEFQSNSTFTIKHMYNPVFVRDSKNKVGFDPDTKPNVSTR